ncbi:hypothetical protein SPHINGO391_440261 [Sphingomonas aurantiaca]|uniref:Uncharacterized protein n=1 Tax=Sphingomonas aurantiaca TaxID=185949 RepID=A0A5E7Z7P7_9SPHN|nr:hypothetical protein SPHINGO391_440261 [Sphingomonas aurantiaca]
MVHRPYSWAVVPRGEKGRYARTENGPAGPRSRRHRPIVVEAAGLAPGDGEQQGKERESGNILGQRAVSGCHRFQHGRRQWSLCGRASCADVDRRCCRNR